MAHEDIESFSEEISSQLKVYVYRLIDPRNGETFYVGRGRGNRVFCHVRAEQGLEGDPVGNRLTRIREIRVAGLEVGHVIHRHGMDQEAASEVEAALIDAYPGLTNVVEGIYSAERGVMHAKEIIRRYAAEPAEFQHRALLINVNRTSAEASLYEATRFAWKISRRRASKAEVVLACVRGFIVGAFVADKWLDATAANFPGTEDRPGRLGFVGHEAPADIQALYVNKRVPDEFRTRGAANPIRYVDPATARHERAAGAA